MAVLKVAKLGNPILRQVARQVDLKELADQKSELQKFIDDMIDTAGTICNAAETAIDQGASLVTAVGTHPVLSGESITRLMNSPIQKVVVCNTIHIPEDKIFEKLEIISVAHVFAEAIKHVTEGTSLSSMFAQ